MKKIKVISALALLLLAGLTVVGCQTPEAKLEASQDRLQRRIAGYHEALGWRDFTAAAKFVAPDSRMEFHALAQRWERGYTLDSWVLRDLTVEGDKAKALVYRTFVMPPSVTLQNTSILLSWVLIEKEWYLAGPPF